jgi:hypothetical protein
MLKRRNDCVLAGDSKTCSLIGGTIKSPLLTCGYDPDMRSLAERTKPEILYTSKVMYIMFKS